MTSVFLRSRYTLAKNNISSAFSNLSDQQIHTIINGCWINLGMGLSDFSKIPRLSKSDYGSIVDIEGMEHLKKSMQHGKGILLLTAHYGSWELGAQCFPFADIETAVIARRIKNPYVNEWVNQVRAFNGNTVILARNAVKESIRWLKNGHLLAVLMDHRIAEGDNIVPFFNRPAQTTTLPALLAHRYSVPVHSARSWREKDRLKIEISPLLSFPESGSGKKALYDVTLKMNQHIEKWVQDKPEMWLWLHNRWKT